jgi:hypothetical protein
MQITNVCKQSDAVPPIFVNSSSAGLQAIHDFLNAFDRTERQADVASRHIAFARIDTDERAPEALTHPLRGVAHGGNGFASAQFDHG